MSEKAAHPEREIQRSLAVTSPLMHGPDVAALQKAVNGLLARFKLNGHLAEDGEFGERSAELADKAAYALGLEAAGDSPHSISRIVTQDEQKAIRDPDSRTDAQKKRSARRVKELQDQQAQGSDVRSKILAYCAWGVTNTGAIHYRQSRPYPSSPRALPMYTDCSGFATLAYKDAGGPDPNGLGFNGFGFTGTQLQHCRHIAKAEALPGDLVVYGSYPGMHVVLLKEPGSVADPLTYSHGQEAGPLIVRHSAEVSAHGGAPVSFLRAL